MAMDKKMIYTTRMSIRGQVVIPEGIRHELKLKKGTEFMVTFNSYEQSVELKVLRKK